MRYKPVLSRRDDALALPRTDRFGSGIETFARLHFHKDQHAAPPRHNVDFPDGRAETAAQYAIALGDEIGRGAALRRQAVAKRDAALRLRGLTRRESWPS